MVGFLDDNMTIEEMRLIIQVEAISNCDYYKALDALKTHNWNLEEAVLSLTT